MDTPDLASMLLLESPGGTGGSRSSGSEKECFGTKPAATPLTSPAEPLQTPSTAPPTAPPLLNSPDGTGGFEKECFSAKPKAPPLPSSAAPPVAPPVAPRLNQSGVQSAFKPVQPPGQPGGFTGAGVTRPSFINRLPGHQLSPYHHHRSTTNTCAPDTYRFQPISSGATATAATTAPSTAAAAAAAAAMPQQTTHRTASTQTPTVYPCAGRVNTGGRSTSFIYRGTFGDINSFTPGTIFTRQAPPMTPRARRTTPSLPGGGAADVRGGAASDPSSSDGDFSDDRTERDLVHTSDGNTFDSDGEMCSVIGSIDGENRSGKSDSSFSPSMRDSTDSSADGMSMSSSQEKDTELVVYYDTQSDQPAIDFDRPMGMMIAIEISGGGFKCGKVMQKYMKNATVGGKELGHAMLEVVFKDESIQELCPEQVLQYRTTYLQNEGEKGCEEFKVQI